MQSQTSFRIRYSADPSPVAEALGSSAGPLLDLAAAQSRADGVYLYLLDYEQQLVELASWRGQRPSSADMVHLQLEPRVLHWLLDLERLTVADEPAWQDWRFRTFLEFIPNPFATAVILPLLGAGRLQGLLNFERRSASPFTSQEAAFIAGLQPVLAGLLAVTFRAAETGRLQEELERISEKLAGRKQIERAKGILQARHQWTEEAAYLYLRRMSRTSRRPMIEVARRVIETSIHASRSGGSAAAA